MTRSIHATRRATLCGWALLTWSRQSLPSSQRVTEYFRLTTNLKPIQDKIFHCLSWFQLLSKTILAKMPAVTLYRLDCTTTLNGVKWSHLWIKRVKSVNSQICPGKVKNLLSCPCTMFMLVSGTRGFRNFDSCLRIFYTIFITRKVRPSTFQPLQLRPLNGARQPCSDWNDARHLAMMLIHPSRQGFSLWAVFLCCKQILQANFLSKFLLWAYLIFMSSFPLLWANILCVEQFVYG